MTERYDVAIVLILLLLAAAVFAVWQFRRHAARQRRSHRIEVVTRDKTR